MNKIICNVRYQMDLGCGGDSWRIHGEVDGKTIMPSTPVSFDGYCFETVSGSVYEIMSYQQNPESFREQITNDIRKKGYEVH